MMKVDIKALKEKADKLVCNSVLDGTESDTWSQQRICNIVSIILRESNRCREKYDSVGDLMYVGENLGTVLQATSMTIGGEDNGYLGKLNGAIEVYYTPDLDKDECLIGHGEDFINVKFKGLLDFKPVEHLW